MSDTDFCTKCGAPRAADARFCTGCGTPFEGANAANASSAAKKPAPAAALAMGALFVAAGAVAAYFALREPEKTQRAVAGNPSAPAGQQQASGQQGPPGEGLPSGHPSIELPKEVVAFLDGLAAEAQKNPESVDAWQKLTRARYRASVINASYRTSAEQSLQKLLALDPDNSEGLRIAANLAYDARDFPEAQKRFEAFLAKNPDDASALTDLGSSLLFQDRLDEAAARYRTAIDKDPKFMQAHFNLGIAEEKRGRKDEAVASLKRALDLATTPDEKQHIENALAEVEGREPMKIAGAGEKTSAPASPPAAATAPGGAPPAANTQGGMPMPPPAPDRAVPTNASTDFQRKAEKPIITHPIVGPRVTAFEWTGAQAARAKIADFPMDQMPPFARTKFKSGMAEKLAAVAKEAGVAGSVSVELIDQASGRVMDTLSSDAPAENPAAASPAGEPGASPASPGAVPASPGAVLSSPGPSLRPPAANGTPR
jgi:tetratricopeptide (TPR) repeat protein